MAALAINGGSRAVTVEPRERWETPKEEIKALVCQMIDDGIWSQCGRGIPLEFEESFREYLGAEYCLTQDNGTSTLWSAYYAVGVGPGDEVLHPAYTWICSIAGAIQLGARPVFCEIDPETLVIDPADMERRITPRTKAITAVHLYGNVCDMDAIMHIARKHGIAVVEDCSHCHGAEWDGHKLGTIGDVGCFSMQGAPPLGKPICAGEGGIITTNSQELYERILLFCHLNRPGLADAFTNETFRAMAPTNFGVKFRPHAWGLAGALVLLRSLDYRNERRRAYRARIDQGLADIKGVGPVAQYSKAKATGFYGGMRLLYHPEELGGLPAATYVEALKAEGVDISRHGFALTHRLKLFAEGFDVLGPGAPLGGVFRGYPEGSLPTTEEVHERILGMPTFIEETPGYSAQVLTAMRKVAANYRELL